MQLGDNAKFNLAPQTVRVLASLTNTVNVTVFFDPTESLYGLVKELLKEYQFRSPQIRVEYVDYLSQRGRAQEIQAKYKFGAKEGGNRIIFDSNGKVKMVFENQLSEFDYSGLMEKREIRRTSFKGEQLFTSALYSVIDPRPVKAYFLVGNGEHDPTAKGLEGYSKFAALLEDSGIRWEQLSIANADVPADCQLLVIAGPVTPFNGAELDRIEQYINQGGRLLALFNWHTGSRGLGLERILAAWGVEVGHNFVKDPTMQKFNDDQVLVESFGEQQIVRSLRRSRLNFLAPRSISQANPQARSAESAKVTELALTSPTASALRKINEDRFTTERSGTIAMGVAVEKGTIQGVGPDRGATRMVIMGDSLFLGDELIDAEANRDFAANAVSWLVNRDLLIEGIGAHAISEYKINMTETELKNVRWIMLAGAPGGALLIGIVTWLRRRI
jgi:hypothetical protein